MLIYISSGPDFHRDSESEVRKSIFYLWHLMWPYLCFSHILEEIGPPPVMMNCISSEPDFYRDSGSKVRSPKFHRLNPQVHDSILQNLCNVVTDSTMTAIYMPTVSFCAVNNKT